MTMKKSRQQPYYGGNNNGKARRRTPITSKTKSFGYHATVNNLLLDLAPASDVETNTSSDIVSQVNVKNDGYVPALAVFQFFRYTDAVSPGAAEFVHFLLNPGDEISLPATRAIIAEDAQQYIGTAVVSTAPNTAEKVDTGDNVASGEINNTTDPVVFELDNGHEKYRVGDKLRIENEIVRVEGTFDDNPTSETVPDNHIVVSRGWNGSTTAAHSGTPDVHFAFFNDYQNYNWTIQTNGGDAELVATDDLGRFRASNFFGYGRASSGEGGIMAGSVAIQFYTQAKAVLHIGDATANTESGLTASTSYEFDIRIDGNSVFSNLTFTTDSSNTKFGGSTGIVAKIQDALDTQYYTAGNLFEKKVTVGLEDGDLVFRSGSYLTTSSVTVSAGSTGTAEFLGTGRIPSTATTIDPRLELDTFTDPVTDGTTYKEIFIRDDGRGNLIWKNEERVGTVNYETGAIEWTLAERPNAEFVVSVLHTSAMSGKLATATAGNNVRLNSLRQVLGNTPQQKCEAKLTVTTF